MGSPYLNSGEHIILTTDRVSVDAVPSDAILTTQRLILVDNRYERFEPRIIPLISISVVKGGKNSRDEPIITLTFVSSHDIPASEPVYLIFRQQPGEDRMREANEWVKKIIEQVVVAHQQVSAPDVVSPAAKKGIRPLVRRWVAPDMIQPHTTREYREQEDFDTRQNMELDEDRVKPGDDGKSGGIPTQPSSVDDDVIWTYDENTGHITSEIPAATEVTVESSLQTLQGEDTDESYQPVTEPFHGIPEEERVGEPGECSTILSGNDEAPLLDSVPENVSTEISDTLPEYISQEVRDETELQDADMDRTIPPEECQTGFSEPEMISEDLSSGESESEESLNIPDGSMEVSNPPDPSEIRKLQTGMDETIQPLPKQGSTDTPANAISDEPVSEVSGEPPKFTENEDEISLMDSTRGEESPLSPERQMDVSDLSLPSGLHDTSDHVPADEEIHEIKRAYPDEPEPVVMEETAKPPQVPVTIQPGVSPDVPASLAFPEDQAGSSQTSRSSVKNQTALSDAGSGITSPVSGELLPAPEPDEPSFQHHEFSSEPEHPVHDEQKAIVISAALQQLSKPDGWKKPEPPISADIDIVHEPHSEVMAADTPKTPEVIDNPPVQDMSPVHETTPEPLTDLPAPGSPAPVQPSLSPPGIPPSNHRKFVVVASAMVILLAIFAVLVMSPAVLSGNPGNHTPGINTSLTVQQSLTPAPVVIPATGTWVRVRYNGTYLGYIGNPGSMQPVSGTGDQIFAPLRNYELIQASIQKQDYSGEMLTVDVYTHGRLIAERSTRVPHATIDILLDTRTEKPPGVVTTYG